MSNEETNEEEAVTRTRSSESSAYMRRVGQIELNAVNCQQTNMEAGDVKVMRGPKDNKEEIVRPAKWAVTQTNLSLKGNPKGKPTVLSAFATKAEAIDFLRSHESDLKTAAEEEE